MLTSSQQNTWSLRLDDEAATDRLGRELSLYLKAGDVVTLSGDLGTGKTTLARAVIHALAPGTGGFDVPSPTFTLVQSYEFTRVPVFHFDLYRIEQPQELPELGVDDAVAQGTVLIEWPDRMADLLPPDRLDIALTDGGDGARNVAITGHGLWQARVVHMAATAGFIAGSDWAAATRTYFQGDASTRRYERLIRDGGPDALLMDMPARTDDVPVRDGKSYSTLVHLAEDVRAVVAMTQALRALGLNAPEIYAHDVAHGLLLIEDFGDLVFGRLPPEGEDTERAYAAACDVLVHIGASACPANLPLPGGGEHVLHAYDSGTLHFEADLVLDWFWPLLRTDMPDATARAAFTEISEACFARLTGDRPVWVLRDYHSPNLLWLPDRDGLHRIGLIDYQDAMMGHAAYDLVSLLQDARIDVSPEREIRLFDYYVERRTERDPGFDAQAFRAAYAVLGTQRCSKILGIFARLDRRDGKPIYLRHMPRVSGYLERNLAHPALADMKRWYDSHLPHADRIKAGNGTG
ncbi:MAG: tRNA (adenosine(37)-N6)-threonylcarbamoyltransferase complex ATPase subunit type 1 TsaE [Hyphomicrobiales bacterium]